MIKNIVFDFGNIIVDFDLERLINNFTNNYSEQEFIKNNIIFTPEWENDNIVDTGFITVKDAITIQSDRTNHVNDELIKEFWNGFNNYGIINEKVINLIKKIKQNGYKVYILSNMNELTYEMFGDKNIFNLFDGEIISCNIHMIKPYKGIFEYLLKTYNLKAEECLFIDDREKNVLSANECGIKGKAVLENNYDDIIKLLDEYNINYK